MRLPIRTLRRLAIFGLGALSIWLIVHVFGWVERELPLILALAATYGLAAYVIIPYIVRMGLKIIRHERVPRYTITGDGLPGDPVNLALIGTFDELRASFAKAGWDEADPLSLASSWRMARAFVLNRPYPTAPFSTLYLFGRRHDVGFQKAIDGSPRKRHHIRFWAKNLTETERVNERFWLSTDRPDESDCVMWVGAGTKDTGLSLTRLTFKMTHATDSDTDSERDYIMATLADHGAIGDATVYEAGDRLDAGAVNHYVTDGVVAVASLHKRAAAPETSER